jgi:hypothetical protein
MVLAVESRSTDNLTRYLGAENILGHSSEVQLEMNYLDSNILLNERMDVGDLRTSH